jgi:hypothetical protein
LVIVGIALLYVNYWRAFLGFAVFPDLLIMGAVITVHGAVCILCDLARDTEAIRRAVESSDQAALTCPLIPVRKSERSRAG